MTADSDGSVALRRRVLIGCSERCALDTIAAIARRGGWQPAADAHRTYAGGRGAGGRRRRRGHNDFLWAKILLLHAENLFIDFGAES
jgi:hypothetical protein